MPSINVLKEKHRKMLEEAKQVLEEIKKIEKTDPFGILEFLESERIAWNNSNKLITICKRGVYNTLANDKTWFYLRFKKEYIENFISLQFTSFLAHNGLYMFNILNDELDNDCYYIQISTLEGIQSHLKNWGTENRP